jgi:hypothetical protein
MGMVGFMRRQQPESSVRRSCAPVTAAAFGRDRSLKPASGKSVPLSVDQKRRRGSRDQSEDWSESLA